MIIFAIVRVKVSRINNGMQCDTVKKVRELLMVYDIASPYF